MPLLEARGHTVIAPELLGMGDDPTQISKISLSKWVDQVAEVVQGLGRRVVLVGHSRGGAIISSVAERVPESIAALVYLTAFLLPDGGSLGDQLNAMRGDRPALPAISFTADGAMRIDPAAIGAFLYGTTEREWQERAAALSGPDPAAVFKDRVQLNAERFGTVPRVYVETLRDIALPLEHQRQMQRSLPINSVYRLDTDHSPFYSDPTGLARVLESVGAQWDRRRS